MRPEIKFAFEHPVVYGVTVLYAILLLPVALVGLVAAIVLFPIRKLRGER